MAQPWASADKLEADLAEGGGGGGTSPSAGCHCRPPPLHAAEEGAQGTLARTLTRAKYRQPAASPAPSPKKAWIPMEQVV